MEDLEAIRARLAQLTPSVRAQLAERSGVPLSTVSKFALGHNREPGYSTVAAIARVLPEFESAAASS